MAFTTEQLGVLNQTPIYGNAEDFINVGDQTYFLAWTISGQDTKLWKTDGTSSGTVLLDTQQCTDLANVGGTLFFSALDAHTGTELWKTDGTAGGTVLVKDVNPGAVSSNPHYLTDVEGTLFFVANDGSEGQELWRSDGTSSGTSVVSDIRSGSASSYPHYLTAAAGRIFFVANDGAHSWQLWQASGSGGPATLVDDINGSSGAFRFNQWPPAAATSPFEIIGDTMFFAARDSDGTELWKTDGTNGGTALVDDIEPGPSSSYPGSLANVGGTLYFDAADSLHGFELWRSDGTSSGTFLVDDINPGDADSSPQNLVNLNGTLVFDAMTQAGFQAYSSDGTDTGTTPIGAFGIANTSFATVGSELFFAGEEYESGSFVWELWKSDGTSSGTAEVAVVGRFYGYNLLTNLVNSNGILLFTVRGRDSGDTVWKSDGTSSGTSIVSPVLSGYFGSWPDSYVSVGPLTYFDASSVAGEALYQTDGTSSGTRLVSQTALTITSVGSTLFGSGYSGETPALFKLNAGGNLALVADAPEADTLLNCNGLLVFGSWYEDQLWSSDGTSSGTIPIASFTSYSLYRTAFVDGELYFTANDGTHGTELWRTDGTSSGTALIADVNPGSGGSSIASLTAVGDDVFFTVSVESHTSELWKSDGTSSGTVLVSDFSAGGAAALPKNLQAADGLLFFISTLATGYEELWESDGTASGTRIIEALNLGYNASFPGFDVAVGNELYFSFDSSNSSELWKTDGTSTGTALVARLGNAANDAYKLTNVNGTLFFGVALTESDVAIWTSDGTSSGTSLVGDTGGTTTMPYVSSNGMLLFTGNDGYDGPNPWVAKATANTPTVTGTTTDMNVQTASGLVVTRNAADGSEVGFVQITDITGGTLYENDGMTPIADGEFVPFDQAAAGLKFTPAPGSTANGSFVVQASTTDDASGLGGDPVTATITVNPFAVSGNTLTITGSSGDNVTIILPGAGNPWQVTLNGTMQTFDASQVTYVDYVGEDNTATLIVSGSTGNSSASMSPHSLAVAAGNYNVSASAEQSTYFYGIAGDTAELFGAADSNTLAITDMYSYLGDGTYFNLVAGASQVYAYGSAADVAFLYTGAADTFVSTPTYSYQTSGADFLAAEDFPVAYAMATTSGTGTAYFYAGSSAAYVVTPSYAYLSGSGYFNEAVGFATSYGFAADSTDTAYFYDSGGNEFVASPNFSYLTGASGFFYAAENFAIVAAWAASPADTAYLYDGPGANALIAQGGSATLTTEAGPESVTGFSQVTAINSAGDNDTEQASAVDFALATIGIWLVSTPA